MSSPRAYVSITLSYVRQVTASELRQNVYQLLDEVLESGEPLEIGRRGRVLRIVPEAQPSKTAAIRGNPDALVGDPDDIVHMDWSPAWVPQA